jgi:hypothetical protein
MSHLALPANPEPAVGMKSFAEFAAAVVVIYPAAHLCARLGISTRSSAHLTKIRPRQAAVRTLTGYPSDV